MAALPLLKRGQPFQSGQQSAAAKRALRMRCGSFQVGPIGWAQIAGLRTNNATTVLGDTRCELKFCAQLQLRLASVLHSSLRWRLTRRVCRISDDSRSLDSTRAFATTLKGGTISLLLYVSHSLYNERTALQACTLFHAQGRIFQRPLCARTLTYLPTQFFHSSKRKNTH